MRDYRRQAKVALAAYLERSLKARRLVEMGSLDKLPEAMRMKSAAFHNFRAADEVLKQTGVDLAGDEVIQDLWMQIAAVDAELEQSIRSVRDDALNEIASARKARTGISKFRSRYKNVSGFIQTV